MKVQAMKLASLAENVYVKIPVTNTQGVSTYGLIKELTGEGVRLNITAIFTKDQIKNVSESIVNDAPCVISIFAGRNC